MPSAFEKDSLDRPRRESLALIQVCFLAWNCKLDWRHSFKSKPANPKAPEGLINPSHLRSHNKRSTTLPSGPSLPEIKTHLHHSTKRSWVAIPPRWKNHSSTKRVVQLPIAALLNLVCIASCLPVANTVSALDETASFFPSDGNHVNRSAAAHQTSEQITRAEEVDGIAVTTRPSMATNQLSSTQRSFPPPDVYRYESQTLQDMAFDFEICTCLKCSDSEPW